jgi:AcrR family transcriptional regulator
MTVTDAVKDASRFRHGRVPAAVRERQVLAIAEELFAEKGYEGTSMAEVARRAGVSKPVVYGLVRSKEELFRRCFEHASEELATEVAAAAEAHPDDVPELLRDSALAFFHFIRAHGRAWESLFSLDAAGRTGTHLSEIRERQARFAASLLREAAAREGVELAADRAEAAAHGLNGVYEALAHWWRGHPEIAPDTLADWLVELSLPGIEALTGRRGGD